MNHNTKSDIVFLLGKNNIEKSSVLHAYRYFTSPSQKALITDFYEQDTTKEIVIEATFLKEDIDNFNEKGWKIRTYSDKCYAEYHFY